MKKLLISLLFPLSCFSQSLEPPILLPTSPVLPSPNAEALGKFGVIPISHYTGIPSISLPLFNLSARGYSVPVSLSYHASGIRVNELGSSVGLGWVLNVGGSISRVVRGNSKDEKNGVGFLSHCEQIGQFPDQAYNDDTYISYSQDGAADSQPDYFTFNFGDNSGNFVLDCNGEAVLQKYSKIKITIKSRTLDDINEWEIVDENGTRFLFEEYETTFSESFYAVPDATCMTGPLPSNERLPQSVSNTSWHLTKIITRKGDEITLVYEDQRMEYSLFGSEMRSREQPDGPSILGYDYKCNAVTIFQKYTVLGKRLTGMNVLSSGESITFEKGALRFDLPSFLSSATPFGDYTVGSVSLRNSSGLAVKKFTLDYGYLNNTSAIVTNATAYNENYRLMLLSVKQSAGVSDQPPYQFMYHMGIGFPKRSSYAIDELGYFNGQVNNNSLIPDKWNLGILGDASCTVCDNDVVCNRTQNFDKAIIGTIKKIIYPTGGFSEFEFEFSSTSHEIRAIRIKKILHNDGDKISETTSYSYPEERKLYNLNIPGTTTITTWSKFFGGILRCYLTIVHNRHSKSKYILDPSTAGQIVYPHVVERKTYVNQTGQEIDNGRSEYFYTFKNNEYFEAFGEIGVIDFSWKRGWLEKTQYYKSTDALLKEEILSYANSEDDSVLEAIVSSRKVSGALVFFRCGVRCSPVTECTTLAKYTIPSNYYHLKQKREIQYGPGQEVILENTYDYKYSPVHLQLTEQSMVSSDGQQRSLKYKYPLDMTYPDSPLDVAAEGIKGMIDKNVVKTPLETHSLINNKTISATLTEFKNINDLIVPDKTHTLKIQVPVSDFMPSDIVENQFIKEDRYEENVVFDRYDLNGQVLQYHTPEGVNTTMLYTNKGLVKAEARNARYGEILFDSFEDSTVLTQISGLANYSNTERKTGNKSLQITPDPITHKASLFLSPVLFNSTIAVGRKFRVEALIKGAGANFRVKQNCGVQNHVNYSSASAPSTSGNWQWYVWEFTLTSPCITATELYLEIDQFNSGGNAPVYFDEVRFYPAESQMNSYTYDPILGMTSHTDTNGVLEFYEYDSLGRLTLIRDDKGAIIKQVKYNYKR